MTITEKMILIKNAVPKRTKRPSGLNGAEVVVMLSMLGAAFVVLVVCGVFYFFGGHALIGKRDDESLMNNGYY